jgi:large subunit ribosomal protein L21
MYAVVRTGGKQYMVKPGLKFSVEKLAGEKGNKIELSDVLLLADDKGETVIGKPVVRGAKVECEVVTQAKSKKEIVFKFRRRKRYMRKRGHRQNLTMLMVKSISNGAQIWNMEGN